MTSRNLTLVTNTRLKEHTVAAVCIHNITTADATLTVQQAANTSKIVIMRRQNCWNIGHYACQKNELYNKSTETSQQIHNKSCK